MSERLRDWLPPEVAEQAAVRSAVAGVVAGWSSHWFLEDSFSLAAWGFAAETPGPADATWRDCGGGLEAGCSPRAALRLASLAIGLRPEQVELTDRDRRLLAVLARRMVDDLVERLRRALGVDGSPIDIAVGDRRLAARISDGCDSLVALSIPFPLLLKLARQTLPKQSSRAPAPLTSRRQALAPATLRLEATLGAARLGLPEARGLAVGDVLVLDRTLDEAVDLTVNGVAVGRGVLTETDGQMALILQNTL